MSYRLKRKDPEAYRKRKVRMERKKKERANRKFEEGFTPIPRTGIKYKVAQAKEQVKRIKRRYVEERDG